MAASIQHIYDHEAAFYDFTRQFTLTHKRDAVDLLGLQENMHVLEVGCGTGENFIYINKKLNNTGKIVGVDLSGKMLDKALEKVRKHQFTNVELYNTDINDFQPGIMFNAIYFADCFIFMPDIEKTIHKAFSLLKPGGTIVIIDFKTSDHGILSLFNPYWVKLSNKYGGDFSKRPWVALEKIAGNVTLFQYHGGLRYIAKATKKN